jgi:hypothetical protein
MADIEAAAHRYVRREEARRAERAAVAAKENMIREVARLEALAPLAEEIAATVLDHIEASCCIVKDQLAERVHAMLLMSKAAKALWADPLAPESKASRALTTRVAPGPSAQALTSDERNLMREALRCMASRDARSADHSTQGDSWVRKMRERAAIATRLADAIADGAGVELRPPPG